MRKLGIAIVVILALLIGGDRVADVIAERAVGDALQTSQHLPSRPAVDIAGFPFLTQLIAQEFDEVTITARNVPLGDQRLSVRLSEIRAVMKDVKVDFSRDRVTIGRGSAAAVIRYGELSKTLDVDVSYAGKGNIKASKQITVAGQTFNPGVTVSPKLVSGALAFGSATVNDAQGIPANLIASLLDTFGANIALDRIPFGLTLRSLSANNVGIVILLDGRNVTLQKR